MYDLYISYSRADDYAQPNGQVGWVSQFKELLAIQVNQLLGHKDSASVFFDTQYIGGNLQITQSNRDAVTNTATLVVVLSPGYLASSWCQKELELFTQSCNSRRDAEGRVFVAVLEPVDIDDKPWPLADVEGFKFFDIDSQTKDPITAWPPNDTFAKELNRLRRRIVERLKTLMVPTSPTPDILEKSSGTVYLTEDSYGIIETCQQLGDEFRQLGYRVVPGKPFYHAPDDYQRQIDAALSEADLVVQLLGAGDYPAIADKYPDGYQRWLYDCAKRSGKELLRWRDSRLQLDQIRDDQYRNFVAADDVIADDLVELRRIAEQRLKQIRTKAPPEPIVLVHSDPVDSSQARAVTEFLGRNQLSYCTEEKDSVADVVNLLPYSGLLILYGRCDLSRVRRQAQDYVRLRLERRGNVPVAAVYVGEPDQKPPLDFKLPGLDVIDHDKPDALDHFVGRVRALQRA